MLEIVSGNHSYSKEVSGEKGKKHFSSTETKHTAGVKEEYPQTNLFTTKMREIRIKCYTFTELKQQLWPYVILCGIRAVNSLNQ